ncbi:MAG: SH3 domain-containing protein, partial [Polyangiales bacterium]
APNNAHAVNPDAPPIAQGLSKAQTTANMMGVDDMESAPNNAHAVNPNAPPIEASKVLKDETVIGGSSEVKKPEIIRASETLKDPNQAEEQQKPADAAKDDDSENEGSSGGAKAEVGPVKITASVLRVRSSPSLGKGNVVGRLTKGTVVEAIGHSGDWVEIQYKGQTAFIHSSFVVGAEVAAAGAKAPDHGAASSTP